MIKNIYWVYSLVCPLWFQKPKILPISLIFHASTIQLYHNNSFVVVKESTRKCLKTKKNVGFKSRKNVNEVVSLQMLFFIFQFLSIHVKRFFSFLFFGSESKTWNENNGIFRNKIFFITNFVDFH